MADPTTIVPDEPAQAQQITPDQPPDLEPIFQAAGQKYGLDPALLKAVAQQESSGNPGAIGPPTSTGGHAYGLMQILDTNLKKYGVTDWRDPAQSIDAGARILKEQMAAKGNVHDALAGYSGGAKNYASNVLSKLQIVPDAEAATPDNAASAIVPDEPPAAPQAGSITPDQPAPQGAQPGFMSGLYRGMGESMKGVSQTAGLVSGTATPSQPQADDALNQELKKSFFQGMFDPHWWTSQLGHAIGSAGPMVGGAMAGAAAGEAVEPAGGGLVGGALGGGLGNMIQTLGPQVKDNMAKGQNFNDALDSALKTTGMESTIVGAMSAVPGGKLLGDWAAGTAKRAISEALIKILGVQPAIGAVGQAAISGTEEGRFPTLDEFLTNYVQNAGLGAALHFGHVAAGKLLPGKPAGETEAPPPPALGKSTDDLLRGMGPTTAPPEPGLPGVTTPLSRTTGEIGQAPTPPIPSPDNTGQSGPVPSGEQVVKSGAEQVNAKPAIIDAASVVRPEDIDPNKKVSLGPLYRGTEGGLTPEAAAQRTMVGGDLGNGVYVTPDEKLAGTYGGGPKASVAAGTRAVHTYEPPSLYPEEVAYVFGGAKIGEPVRIVSGNGIELYHGPWTGGTGKPGGAMEEALQANEGIKAVVGTPDSIGVNQIAVRDPSILQPRAQPLEAAPAPELRGPVFAPTATEHLPEIQPDQPAAQGQIVRDADRFSDLNNLPEAADMDQMIQQEKGSDRDKLVQALGSEATAKDFERLDRQRNSSDPDRADAAEEEFNRKFGNLTPRQERLVYGVHDPNAYTAEDLGQIQRAIGDTDFHPDDTHEQVGQEAVVGLRDMGDQARSDFWGAARGDHGAQAQAGAIRFYRGYQELVNRGLGKAEIDKALVDGLRGIGYKPADAVDTLRDYTEAMQKAPPPRQALPAPEPEAKPATPIAKVLEEKPASAPMPKEITDEVAAGTKETTDAIGELLTEAAAGGGGGREPPKPPPGGGPPKPPSDPGRRRRSLLGTADRIIAAVNTMPDDPLSYNRMSAAARVFGLAPGVAAADRTGATYLDSLTERDATKHAGVYDGEAAAKDYGGLSYKRQLPINKVLEYHDATGQELPTPHKDGSMTLTMDPKAFGELPWMLQMSEPGEKVSLDPKQTKILSDLRDFLDRRHAELAESAARKIGYDGRFLTTDADGKLQIDLPTIKHAFDTATDKGLKKTAERALGIATAATESKRVSYFPRARYGDWTIHVTPLVPMTGTGHALPGETWFEKVESGTPFDSLKGIVKSEYGGGAPRKVTQRVAELEKQFPPDKYRINYTKPPPKLRDLINVPMVERVLDDIEFKDEKGNPMSTAAARAELKDKIIEAMYDKMLAGFRQHREGVPGASTDFPRALGDYIRQSASVVGNAKHSRAVDEAYLNTQQHRDPRTASYWAAHKAYNDSNDSTLWSSARKVGFFKYLWGSPMSALVQLTQTPMITGSQLAGVIGPRGLVMPNTAVMRTLLSGLRIDGNGVTVDVTKLKPHLTPGEYAGLIQALREGRLNPVLPHSLGGGTMSAKMRNSPIFKVPSRLYDMGSSMFNAADTANRVASWLSYYRAAQLPGAAAKFAKAYKNDALFQQAVGDHVDPTRLANWAINETQFMSGRQGGAPIMRGPGSLAFQFQHYNSNYIRLLHKNFTRMGPQGKVAGTLMLGGLMGMGGVLGFPFARDAEDAADAIGKFVFGIDPRIDAHIREFIADSGMAKLADGYMGLTPGTFAEMLTEGPSRWATGMDLGNRIGLGHMLPGTTDLTTGVPFLDATVGAAIEAHKRLATQQPLGAMAAVMPAGLENPFKALAVYPNEGVKQASGTNVLLPSQVTPGMKAARLLGATPATIARKQQAMSDANRIKYATDEAAKNLLNSIVGQFSLAQDAKNQGNADAAAAYEDKAQQLIKANVDRLRDSSVEAWQQIPQPTAAQIRRGIIRYMNPLQPSNTRALRSKQAELAASPYLQQ